MRLISAILLAAVAMATVIPHYSPPERDAPAAVWQEDLLPSLRAGGPVAGLGPFTLAGAWWLHSSARRFGNYSALGSLPDGSLLALSDRSSALQFTKPDQPGPRFAHMTLLKVPDDSLGQTWGDSESLIVLPRNGHLLMIDEGTPDVVEFTPDMRRTGRRIIPALMEWSLNQGPEASAILADGRTIMLQEGYASLLGRTLHNGFVFAEVPRNHESPGRFRIAMLSGYRPTELARLPDGRLLVLGRKFTLGGFRSLIAVLDPATIHTNATVTPRVVAHISDPRVRDNYEGMTVTPEGDSKVAVWLISDSNDMVLLQRTLLLKLRIDPRQL